jgi:hypothetical protein
MQVQAESMYRAKPGEQRELTPRFAPSGAPASSGEGQKRRKPNGRCRKKPDPTRPFPLYIKDSWDGELHGATVLGHAVIRNKLVEV